MQKITGKIYSWASIIEEQARQQVFRTASLGIVQPYIAVMPDVHYGRGCCVGIALPTVGAVIPAAVGVDIGCVDAESEYLSPSGWRKISEYDGGPVMEYDPDTETGMFVQPSAYIVKSYEKMYKLHTKYGVDQVLSPDHRMLVWCPSGRKEELRREVITAGEFAARHNRLKQGFKARFKTTFIPMISTSLPFTADEIRVQVMVNADAHIEGKMAVVRLKKEHKIERARKLLALANIEWTEKAYGDVVSFRFRPPLPEKGYTAFWQADFAQLMHIADEVCYWDGNRTGGCFYTRDRESADFIQYVFTAMGKRATLRADVNLRDGKTDYRVFRIDGRGMVTMGGSPNRVPVTLEENPGGKAYCFTVPSGFWVMRRGGNVVMTGNCGMIAFQTQYRAADLRGRDLSVLREMIERAIPLSAGNYNRSVGLRHTRERVEMLEKLPGADAATEIAPNWHLQLGSLGSGNHFIEVCLDEDGKVWLFLHSGSRGVGNKLATRHIQVAQKVCPVPVPDRDLAYLVEGTAEFAAYMRDLEWAQEFAYLNRAEMMDRVRDCFAEWLGAGQVLPVDLVNCHHNYTERETLTLEDGSLLDVWLSRKGAIDARLGAPGLIPGSMGTRSYVVHGLGNAQALFTSPHGAGRRFSRGAARREFTEKDLVRAMAGIEFNRARAGKFIDEIPGAYKPIKTVMEDAAELAGIDHELRQVLNVKGD